MKTTFLTIAAVVLGGYCLAQGAKAPKAAIEDFQHRSAAGTIATWEKEGNHFEAEYTEAGREIAVLYDAQGKYIMTESEINVADLPQEIQDAVSKSMSGAILLEAERQDKADNSVGYQVEVKHAGKVKEVTFDAKGNMVGTEREGHGGSGSGSGSNDPDKH